MADTQFELDMDEFSSRSLPWRTWVQFRNSAGNWETNRYDIKENVDYRVGFRVTNRGTETYVKNVEIRVVNHYPARVAYFADDTYTQQVPRSQTLFAATLAPGQYTPWHWVYFRLGAGPDEYAGIGHVGIYAEIVPQGHYWSDFEAPLD